MTSNGIRTVTAGQQKDNSLVSCWNKKKTMEETAEGLSRERWLLRHGLTKNHLGVWAVALGRGWSSRGSYVRSLESDRRKNRNTSGPYWYLVGLRRLCVLVEEGWTPYYRNDAAQDLCNIYNGMVNKKKQKTLDPGPDAPYPNIYLAPPEEE